MRPILQQARLDTDSFDIAFQMHIDKTILLDTAPLQKVDNVVSMWWALHTMVLSAPNKAHVHALVVCLMTTLQATGSASAPLHLFRWFLENPTRGAPAIQNLTNIGWIGNDAVTVMGQPVGKKETKSTTAPPI